MHSEGVPPVFQSCTLSGAIFFPTLFGGLRCVSTAGYYLAALRAAVCAWRLLLASAPASCLNSPPGP